MLKFYEWEKVEFKDAYNRKLDTTEVKMLFKKLIRHFKIRNCSLTFANKARGGRYYIIMPYRWSSIGVLCHELAHTYEIQRFNNNKHNKKLKRTFTRFVNYCRKKNFWESELKKRTEIKIKPVPTEQEIRLKKIEKRKADLIRYNKRLNYFTKLYQNKIKKANRSLAMLERHHNLTLKNP